MKKSVCFLMILSLLWSCALCAVGEEGLIAAVCVEQGFSTKIPAGKTAQWEENTGFRISVGKPGYVPYVVVFRRPQKLNNPVNYLNNVYREYMENRYNNDVGTNPCRQIEIGGKTLYMAQYHYKASGNALCLALLIEVRDDGDVEYSAKFEEGKGDETMAVLETAVRYYEVSGAGSGALRPADVSGRAVNTLNGVYQVKITDTDRIMEGGYFTASLYLRDLYPAEGIEALRPGDQVQVNGQVFTVSSLMAHDGGAIEVVPQEAFDGYIVFQKNDEGYTALVNDWSPVSFVANYRVMLPLSNDFSFRYGSDPDQADVCGADAFIRLLTNPDAPDLKLNPYNTVIRFQDDLVRAISYADYPAGPET